MDNPLISIIVPVYNTEPYLRKCVDSILAQTYENLEVILVDDGSPDGCPAICDEYAEIDSRIAVIHQKNAGASAARNVGLRAAKGEYIGFVDSDDWIESDMYEILFNLIKSYEADISVVSLCHETSDLAYDKEENVEVFSSDEAIREMFIGKKFQGHMVNKLVYYQLFSDNEFPVGITICEDQVLAAKLILKASKLAYRNYNCYHYVNRNNSATKTFNVKYLSIIDGYKLILEDVKRKSPCNVTLVELRMIIACLATGYLAAKANALDVSSYKIIKKCIKDVKNRNYYLEMKLKYRFTLIAFCIGRIPYIMLTKIFDPQKYKLV